MFSDKININILTALLLKHGIGTAVVCPGSRNAPMVHNFHAAGMECHPVTDERSAGFYALGLALAKRRPVVVCVTSGSALLNLAPAVAEAAYRQCPIVVVSADRPAARIGQLDGQTVEQPGALGSHVAISVDLPEPQDNEGICHCRRLVNEALIAVSHKPSMPVHINVRISEPLFGFTAESLPDERPVRLFQGMKNHSRAILQRLRQAHRPMVVLGQCPLSESLTRSIDRIRQYVVVLNEPLSSGNGGVPFDGALALIDGKLEYCPDFILFAGGTLVSKRIKSFLRDAPGAETWAISPDGKIHDIFSNQTAVLECEPEPTFAAIAEEISSIGNEDFLSLWNDALNVSYSEDCPYSEELAVRLFEEMVEPGDSVHYANSTAVRLACRHSRHYTYVNRGVNGIEGSLSTAAGFSLAAPGRTLCVIGDLSFFYDCNALWNSEIGGNFRILLLNNGGGSIFRTLPGLEASDVRDTLIMASHGASAEGICRSYGIEYLSARNEAELRDKMLKFMHGDAVRPIVFEVFYES